MSVSGCQIKGNTTSIAAAAAAAGRSDREETSANTRLHELMLLKLQLFKTWERGHVLLAERTPDFGAPQKATSQGLSQDKTNSVHEMNWLFDRSW